MANVYSKSYLQASPALVNICEKLIYGRLLPIVANLASTRTAVDVLDLNFAANMDFINAYLFGLCNGSNFLEDEKTRRWWMNLYQGRKSLLFWPQELPRVQEWLSFIGIKLVPDWVDAANKEIEDWNLVMCDAAEKAIDHADASRQIVMKRGDVPIVYQQMKTAMDKDRDKSGEAVTAEYRSQQRLEIASEMMDQLGAGHETSAIALAYLYWELSRNPTLQQRLRQEVLTLDPPISCPSTNGALPSPKDVDALPFLHACIMETLRLHGPIPGSQPRVTPPNATLGKYSGLPAGVRVQAQGYTLHRNEDVFPNPEEWRPDRWLGDDAGSQDDDAKKRFFWAFGSGGRMCVGSNFAMHGMKYIAAALYTNFVIGTVNDEGIEQEDGYTVGPMSNRLIMEFEHI
ncbi:MAG: hypothetical protein M1827_003210 [Pycnora praestabilis]|nr:MAG: hypothetical protein M1827_003210 [Pycnora praestabilis]